MGETRTIDTATRVQPVVSHVDSAFTKIEKELRLLLNLTPVNALEAWNDFERNGFSVAPQLRSRPLEVDLDLLLRELYNLPLEEIEDPSLHELMIGKRDELARQIGLLRDRDTSRFLYASLALYGAVPQRLVDQATAILKVVSAESASGQKVVTATAFAEEAEAELERYRRAYEGFPSELEIREDVSDLMVSHGRLLIPASAQFRDARVGPLIHHEVGTHVVTYVNGSVQPLEMLSVGLPGYEETQEGLALLSEYAVDGLDPLRMRVLAARVVATRRVLDGAGFIEVFEELHEGHGFAPRTAWSIAIRVTRCGGHTKDVIYLRGIDRVLEFVAERQSLDVLLVGKLSVDQVPLIEELLEREVLDPPWVRPRWLDVDGAPERLQRAYEGMSVLDLIGAER